MTDLHALAAAWEERAEIESAGFYLAGLNDALRRCARELREALAEEGGQWSVGDLVTLHGELRYFQDFAGWSGESPPDLVWTIDKVDNGISLHAAGYGARPGVYGGGGIHISHETLRRSALRLPPPPEAQP